MQHRKAVCAELVGRSLDRAWAFDFKLDGGLRHGSIVRPDGRAEAGLGGLGERPHGEVLAARDVLTVEVVVAFAGLERQSEGVDVELAAFGRVRRDHSHAGDELHIHDLVPALLTDWSPSRDHVRN
jgi:hypothetical protein